MRDRLERSAVVSRTAIAAVILLCTTVLGGWVFDSPALANALPGSTMTVNTALTLAALSVALLLLGGGRRTALARGVGTLLAGFVAVLALLVLAQYVPGVSLPVDEMVIRQSEGAAARADAATLPAGRMAPNTAVALMFLSAAMLLLDARVRGVHPAEWLAVGTAAIAFLALVDLLFGSANASESLPPYRQMAVYTAVALLVLAVGTLAARPHHRLMAVLTAAGGAGTTARGLLFAAATIPIALGWLRLSGEQAGLYDTRFGTALFGTATVVMFSTSVLWYAAAIARAEKALVAAAAERESALEQLRHANTETMGANRELEAFSYSVSHDLRSPLRSIDGFSEALLEEYGSTLDAQGQDYLRRVRAATQRMGDLIDGLLGLARVSRGAVLREAVDLSAMARTIAAELRRSAPARNVEFHIAPALQAEGDPRLLRVVLENLLGNAWKFTSKEPAATIEFLALGEGAAATYVVRDDGAGFDPAHASKLFGAFQRLHSPAEFEGTGIGLATVQRIVQRHDGQIRAEGTPGTGAAFHFTLAASNGAASLETRS